MRLAFATGVALAALLLLTSSVSLAPARSQFECLRFERDVVIDNYGWIHVSDHFVLQNLGNASVRQVQVTLPREAERVVAKDLLEYELPVTVFEHDQLKLATVSLRFQMQPGERASFTISYSLPAGAYVRREADRYVLNATFPEAPWPLEEASVTIFLPAGASAVEAREPLTLIEGNKAHAILAPRDGLPPLVLAYSYSVFWAALYPAIWLGAVSLAIAISASLRSRMLPAPKAPPDFALDFIDVCRRMLSTYQEEISTEQRKERMARREYATRLDRVRTKRATLMPRLLELGKRLRELSVSDVVDRLDRAWLSLDSSLANLREAEAKFRRREISKSLYSVIVEEGREKLDYWTEEVERRIAELRDRLSL